MSRTSRDSVLDVAGLSVAIPAGDGMLRPVRDVTFSLGQGETLALVGESGAGKSLTALAIVGLLPRSAERTAERIAFLREDLRDCPPCRMSALRGRRVAMVFQEPLAALNPVLTIGRQLTEVYRRHVSRNRRAARERAATLLDRVGVTPAATRMRQFPHQLSGGQRQRATIAMAMMASPDLIIADEPTTALDVTTQTQILRLLRDLQADFGTSLLLITHDLGVVARTADRVAVMYDGRIVEEGPCMSVFDRPMHPYTVSLLDNVPSVARPPDRTPPLPHTRMAPDRADEPEGCAFRWRCAQASEACASWSPADTRLDGGHRFACRLPAGAAPDRQPMPR